MKYTLNFFFPGEKKFWSGKEQLKELVNELPKQPLML